MFISVYLNICKMHDDIPDEKNVKFRHLSKTSISSSYLVAYPISFSIPRFTVVDGRNCQTRRGCTHQDS